jgi:hypothetical protein
MSPELPSRRSVTRRALRRLANHNTDRPPVSVAGILTAEFEHEQAPAGVRDLSDPTYPVLAAQERTSLSEADTSEKCQ